MARSTKVAGRKIVGSISTPARAGRSVSRACSTWRVTSRVLACGCFSTIKSSPGPSLMTASPINGNVPSFTTAMSPRVIVVPCRRATDTRARSSGVRTGSVCCTWSRWFGVSTKPPLPITAPFENRRIPESTASAVVVITWSRVRSYFVRRSGITRTCGILIRSPQMATFATPGTRSSRALIVQ